jgi:hypothetical protein
MSAFPTDAECAGANPELAVVAAELLEPDDQIVAPGVALDQRQQRAEQPVALLVHPVREQRAQVPVVGEQPVVEVGHHLGGGRRHQLQARLEGGLVAPVGAAQVVGVRPSAAGAVAAAQP